MSEKTATIKERVKNIRELLEAMHRDTTQHARFVTYKRPLSEAHKTLDDLMAEREKMKELVKDRYEFPVHEWNEQLVQTINDKGCPAKIVLTRRIQSKIKEASDDDGK